MRKDIDKERHRTFLGRLGFLWTMGVCAFAITCKLGRAIGTLY